MLVQGLHGDGDAEESNEVQRRSLSLIFMRIVEKETIGKEGDVGVWRSKDFDARRPE